MITVLVTGAGALLGQGIVRSLQRSSLPLRIVTADPSPLSAALFWGDQGYLIERADHPAYLDRLEDVIRAERPAIVLVGTDVELPVFARERHALEGRHSTRILVSSPQVVSVADDKYLTYEFLARAGLAPPASALPEQPDALDSLIDELGFPLVVKPRIGARSIGMSVVRSRAELDVALAGKDGLLVQECIGDDTSEYTAGVIAFDGAVQAAIVMRRDLRDGNTYRAFVEPFEPLRAAVVAMGDVLQPYGPANFQFRLDEEGTPRVFEINARFSGTTPLRALAGFNEVDICLRRILLDEPVIQPLIQSMTILRYWSEIAIQPADLNQLK